MNRIITTLIPAMAIVTGILLHDAAPAQDREMESLERQAIQTAISAVPESAQPMDLQRISAQYSYGNGFDEIATLEISSDGKFTWQQHHCGEEVKKLAGQAELKDGQLMLAVPAAENKMFHRAYVPVRWGQRLYLIPSMDALPFFNSINHGREPVEQTVVGNYFMREGDWDRSVSGLPLVPEQWKHFFLQRPVRARIIAREREGRWIIPTDATNPLYPGLELSAISPDGSQIIAMKVTGLQPAAALLSEVQANGGTDKNGWEVLSHISDIKNATAKAPQ